MASRTGCLSYFAIAAILATAALGGCGPATVPKDALILIEPTTEIRARQSRKYETLDEKAILIASNQLLQDLGFNLEESNLEVGLLVGSKDRTAVDGGQVIGKIFVAVMIGARVPIDKDQKIRVSVVTAPAGDKKSIVVRVTFQRLVWNDFGELWKVERQGLLAFKHVRHGLVELLILLLIVQKNIQAAGEVGLFCF